MMNRGMAKSRFPLRVRGRGSRRSAEEAPARPKDPLDVMASEIRALDAAAERASQGINAAAESLNESSGHSSARLELMGGVASALVERADQIRADCARLSGLMDRTSKLIAERDGREPTSAAPPAPPEPAPSPVSEVTEVTIYPEPEADEQAPSEPAPRPRWLERDDERDDEPSQSSVGGTSEGVRLIATQMAIAGSSRAEIERRLRIQFGVVDAEKALDDIFGNSRSGVQ
jgi:hypothetical protein